MPHLHMMFRLYHIAVIKNTHVDRVFCCHCEPEHHTSRCSAGCCEAVQLLIPGLLRPQPQFKELELGPRND